MSKIIGKDKHLQQAVVLQLIPEHEEEPTRKGTAASGYADLVIPGSYNMTYKLPGGDRLRLLARHDNSGIVQIILLTHDAKLIDSLPGYRRASLIASTISSMRRYLLRSDSYPLPKTLAQNLKYQYTQDCIAQLSELLPQERELHSDDWEGQEALRINAQEIINACRHRNILLANNIDTAEGALDNIAYETLLMIKEYSFNRISTVSLRDQQNYEDICKQDDNHFPLLIWDSTQLIANEEELKDSLRVIIKHYDLCKAKSLSDIPANRFARLRKFFLNLLKEGKAWVDYHIMEKKPTHRQETKDRNGIIKYKIAPYYYFQGYEQIATETLNELIENLGGNSHNIYTVESLTEVNTALMGQEPGACVHFPAEKKIFIRSNDEVICWRYFQDEEGFLPLPHGEDLAVLSQLSKRHLFFPERLKIAFLGFCAAIPPFFSQLFHSLHAFIRYLIFDFKKHIFSTHSIIMEEDTEMDRYRDFVKKIVLENELMHKEEELEDFLQQQINKHNLVVVREEHPVNPPPYTNPVHHALKGVRHIVDFFVNVSEENPVIGLMAILAYLYGAGAVLAPQFLKSILLKLHAHGLIRAIHPTQELGKWLSHGDVSEALSVAVTYWQCLIIGGNFDHFLIKAVKVLRDDPAQVAVIVSLALGMGYGISKIVPIIDEEMGGFPWYNRFYVGLKGIALLLDIAFHRGDDWLFGSIRWLLTAVNIVLKLLIAPFVEGYYFGTPGFRSGWQKSATLLQQTLIKLSAACLDIILWTAKVPFIEGYALFIHVPFRGFTSLISKVLAAAGQWQILGQNLLDFAYRDTSWDYFSGFRISPLYGFINPLQHYSEQPVLNYIMNCLMLFFSPLQQLLKNFIILPCLDVISLAVRAGLTLLNIGSRVSAFIGGHVCLFLGNPWDNTVGRILCFTASMVTRLSNGLINIMENGRQFFLKRIEVTRRIIYHWAFSTEDENLTKNLNDIDYFKEEPMRLHRLPIDSTKKIFSLIMMPRKAYSESSVVPPKNTAPQVDKHYSHPLKSTSTIVLPISTETSTARKSM